MDSDVIRPARVVPVIVRARALGQGDTVSHTPRLAVARVSENFADSILHTAARSAGDVSHAMSGNQNDASGRAGGPGGAVSQLPDYSRAGVRQYQQFLPRHTSFE